MQPLTCYRCALVQAGLYQISGLCNKASAIRLHALRRGQPLQLGPLTEMLAGACDAANAQLAAFIQETTTLVAATCDKAMEDLHARMEAFTRKQVRACPVSPA